MFVSHFFHRSAPQLVDRQPVINPSVADEVLVRIEAAQAQEASNEPLLPPRSPRVVPPAEVGRLYGCDGIWRAYSHLCLQTGLHVAAIVGSGFASFGALLALADWADQRGRSMDFIEGNSVRLMVGSMILAAFATAASISMAGHARLQGHRPLYYRLAPSSLDGDGSAVRAAGVAAMACILGAATALTSRLIAPEAE